MKLLVSLLFSLVNCSFLDRAFGPLQEGVSLHIQGEPFDHGKEYISIPSEDFIGDLINGAGPLYTGIVTFAHLPLTECFSNNSDADPLDVAILGAPFDTAVTYRPGARFGPAGIREGSRRISGGGAYYPYRPKFNAYTDWANIVECGDVPMTPFDNRVSLDQLYRAHRAILKRNTSVPKTVPRVITLGGDHTTTFSALRAAYEVHGEIAVVHFDSHIDTWDPDALGGNISSYAELNHGTFLHYAHEKGYLARDANLHVGIRAPFIHKHKDADNDHRCGFHSVLARDIDRFGIQGVINAIRQRLGSHKVYITVDIDVLDPVYAPGTGTTEPGGFTTRELLTILDGLEGLDIIGADVVEVAPVYDSSQVTVLAAAEVVNSLISLMVLRGPIE
jgi:agmatinase